MPSAISEAESVRCGAARCEVSCPVIGSSEFLRARDKIQCRISDCGGGETMVITEIGYLFVTLSAVAALLFCRLDCACFGARGAISKRASVRERYHGHE